MSDKRAASGVSSLGSTEVGVLQLRAYREKERIPMLMSAINRMRLRVRNDEGGFTLIELLVVVIIIGILAAIAIPTFLNQRKKGWESAVKSDLRNYAIVAETKLTEDGTYVGLTTPATGTSSGVTVTVEMATATAYCLKGVHTSLGASPYWTLQPGGAMAKDVACPAQPV